MSEKGDRTSFHPDLGSYVHSHNGFEQLESHSTITSNEGQSQLRVEDNCKDIHRISTPTYYQNYSQLSFVNQPFQTHPDTSTAFLHVENGQENNINIFCNSIHSGYENNIPSNYSTFSRSSTQSCVPSSQSFAAFRPSPDISAPTEFLTNLTGPALNRNNAPPKSTSQMIDKETSSLIPGSDSSRLSGTLFNSDVSETLTKFAPSGSGQYAPVSMMHSAPQQSTVTPHHLDGVITSNYQKYSPGSRLYCANSCADMFGTVRAGCPSLQYNSNGYWTNFGQSSPHNSVWSSSNLPSLMSDRNEYQNLNGMHERKMPDSDTLESKYFKKSSSIARTCSSTVWDFSPTCSGSTWEKILDIEVELGRRLMNLDYTQSDVKYISNPLDHAILPHKMFLEKFLDGSKKILFLGMNPGPWGMCQTGIPFGDIESCKKFLRIEADVNHNVWGQHPKRPIEGFKCKRKEVSGSRFWGFMEKLCGNPETFFKNCFVLNHCPLAFMKMSAKNVAPAELPGKLKKEISEICNAALHQIIELLEVKLIIGIGKFAEARARTIVKEHNLDISVGTLMHPSPINPAANKGWDAIAEKTLRELGVLQYIASEVEK